MMPELQRQSSPQMLDKRESLVVFNSDSSIDIPNFLTEWSCSRAILVASKALASNTSVISDLETKLGNTLAATKLGVGSHTPYADVLEVVRFLREHDADALVCVGSSSYSDCCKIARLLHATLPPSAELTEETMTSLVDAKTGRTPSHVLKDPTIKLVLVPTSLSASEYNAVSSASNSHGKKEHFGAFDRDSHAPDLILLDPWVASTAPADLWLMSGIRAIDHCVEIFVASGASDECKKHCMAGLTGLLGGLMEYKKLKGKEEWNRDEAEKQRLLCAISDCQRGAREAISGLICFKSHLGPSHAIGHQLGPHGVPHGKTSCICLAPVLRYETTHPNSGYWDVKAHHEIVKVFNEVLHWTEDTAADAVERFVKEMDMPTRLSEVGIMGEDTLRKIAENTMTDVWGGGEPQLERPGQVLEILEMVR